MARDWSSLHPHLLGLLFDRLYVPDFIRCRAVCTSWRLAALTENPHGPTVPQVPMMLLPRQVLQGDFETLFSLAENRCYQLLPVPDASGFRCVGSFPEGGFLITANRLDHEIYLFNPLTRAEFILPAPIITHDNSYDYLTRVLLSSQLQLISIISDVSRELSLARVGEMHWTENIGQYCSAGEFEDIIFHQNRLYGVCRGGTSVSFDVTASPPVAIPLPNCGGGDRDDEVSDYYLAESTDGAQLLQIWRYNAVRSRQFKVFGLDPSHTHTEWVETKNIGEHSALFLGLGRSMMLSISHLPELKGNRIYYSDVRNKIGHLHDTGIFNIEDGTSQPLFPSGSLLTRSLLTRLAPVWFTPHL